MVRPMIEEESAIGAEVYRSYGLRAKVRDYFQDV
jgi:hypothetical protein